MEEKSLVCSHFERRRCENEMRNLDIFFQIKFIFFSLKKWVSEIQLKVVGCFVEVILTFLEEKIRVECFEKLIILWFLLGIVFLPLPTKVFQ